MTVDYSLIANNSVLLATILVPLLGYIHRESQTYYLDLLAIPFVLFMVAVASSILVPNEYSVYLFVVGVVSVILLYLMMAFETLLFETHRLT